MKTRIIKRIEIGGKKLNGLLVLAMAVSLAISPVPVWAGNDNYSTNPGGTVMATKPVPPPQQPVQPQKTSALRGQVLSGSSSKKQAELGALYGRIPDPLEWYVRGKTATYGVIDPRRNSKITGHRNTDVTVTYGDGKKNTASYRLDRVEFLGLSATSWEVSLKPQQGANLVVGTINLDSSGKATFTPRDPIDYKAYTKSKNVKSQQRVTNLVILSHGPYKNPVAVLTWENA